MLSALSFVKGFFKLCAIDAILRIPTWQSPVLVSIDKLKHQVPNFVSYVRYRSYNWELVT